LSIPGHEAPAHEPHLFKQQYARFITCEDGGSERLNTEQRRSFDCLRKQESARFIVLEVLVQIDSQVGGDDVAPSFIYEVEEPK
jgi:hypothetical protein